MKREKKYWLMKTEPTCYSIDDLKRDKTTAWSGVRNYQARNFMKKMEIGDGVLFYHSNCAEPAVVGIAKVSAKAYADKTQFDAKDEHYDPRSTSSGQAIWQNVDVSFVKKFKNPVTLFQMKTDPSLDGIMVAQKGSRLSVQPVSKKHFEHVESLNSSR
jgi:predicted RNA-binding protein with PUA-like domain